MKSFAKIVGLFYLGVLAAVMAGAQTIVGTVVDITGTTWTNAIVVVHLNNPSGSKALNKITLVPIVTDFSVTTTSTGSFVADFGTGNLNNLGIIPAGTSWQISVCAFVNDGKCQQAVNLINQNSQDISAKISAVLQPPSYPATKLVGAYTDNEITTPVYGNCYLLPTPSLRCRINNSWQSIGASNYGGLNTFGDSITNGAGATTFMQQGSGSTSYASQLINAFGGNGVNYAFGGDMAGDMILKVQTNLHPKISGNFLTTMMDSTNDVSIYGTDTGLQNIFVGALSSSITWAAIPDVAKLQFTNDGSAFNAACSSTGFGASSGSLGVGQLPFVSSTNPNDSFTCTFTMFETGPIYISYIIANQSVWGSASNSSVSIDGGPITNFPSSPSSSSLSTANGVSFINVIVRIAGPFSAGTHSIHIVNTSPNSCSPACATAFTWVGSPYPIPSGTISPPDIFVGGTPWNQNNSPATTTATYNTLISNLVTLLANDGLNVHFVPVRNFLNSTTDYSGGTFANGIICPASAFLPLHPNDCGHAHLAQAFLSSLPPSNFSGPLPGLTYFGPQRSLAGGNGWVFGAQPVVYQSGSSIGFTGTKTAGSCTITFVGGIVTNVTGC